MQNLHDRQAGIQANKISQCQWAHGVIGAEFHRLVDTGHTLAQVMNILNTRNPRSLEVCCLLNKPSRREVEVPMRWTGFDIPDEFVVGYGIDYAENNRNLPHIGKVRLTD